MFIYPYAKNTQIFRCPSSTYNNNGVAYGLPATYAKNSNSTNPGLFGTTAPAMAQLLQPSQSLMLSEKGGGGGNQYILSGQYYACRADHNVMVNVAYFDGHVKLLQGLTSDMGTPWPAANSPAYAVHPPREVCDDVM